MTESKKFSRLPGAKPCFVGSREEDVSKARDKAIKLILNNLIALNNLEPELSSDELDRVRRDKHDLLELFSKMLDMEGVDASDYEAITCKFLKLSGSASDRGVSRDCRYTRRRPSGIS